MRSHFFLSFLSEIFQAKNSSHKQSTSSCNILVSIAESKWVFEMELRDWQSMTSLFYVLSIAQFLFLLVHNSNAADYLTQSQSISGGKTLVSRDGSFEFGFFSPGSSEKLYLGIWYRNIPVKTIVWVANRENPVKDKSGMLILDRQGNLALLSQNKTVVWSANPRRKVLNPIVQLLGSGNLVLRDEKDENPENYLWQSFDYPSDTLLPGMKLGWDLKTGLNRTLSSWKNWDDPSSGDFTWGLVRNGYPEVVMWKGSSEYYRSGPWNGLRFDGAPELRNNPLFGFDFISTEDQLYYTYYLKNGSMISRIVLNQTIYYRQRFIWIKEAQSWRLYASVPRDNCDDYNLCGPYGNCVMGESPVCQCLSGFKPKSPQNWDMMDWNQGCVRSQQLSCDHKNQVGFKRFSGLKYPDSSHSWVNRSINLQECMQKCSENCSCTAYANSDIREGGSGCILWFGDLMDIRQISGDSRDLYIRMKTSEIAVKERHKMKLTTIIIIVVSIVVIVLIFFYIGKTMKLFTEETEDNLMARYNDEGDQEDLELPFLDLPTIVKATDDFSISKKLGQGGFGAVYRGMLVDGKEIAVKRLSQSSGQGLNEFKNEVILISKLQHRNLVKLLGCCIQGEEKMLVYEYMPNKSLDSFIFDHVKCKILDWPRRFNIVYGIARGLLYLHQDSRLRIIHRDLKASNILLDNELNPKISDFGMAKTFGGDQTEGNTNRVVGTYGYMAPEYAIHGLFSVKSDVFSFGVLLLEIISGKKNREFIHSNKSLNLIGHAWRLWKEGRPLELIDSCLDDLFDLSEALRCIHISLLCLQQQPEDRPSMSNVVVMLSSESVLTDPMEPAYIIEKKFSESDSSSKHQFSSTNELSVTMLEPR